MIHYRNFVGVPKDSESGKLFKLFMSELEDEDESDYPFGKFFLPIQSLSMQVRNLIGFHDAYAAESDPRAKSLDDFDLNGMGQMKELNSKTRRAILDYIERHRNNDIVVVMKGMKDGSYVFYAGTDLLNYNVTDNDPKLVLTRLDCHIFNKNCSSKVLPWREAAFFFIISKESGENFFKYYGLQTHNL